MRKLLCLAVVLCLFLVDSHSQEIKRSTPVFDDFIPVLEDAGYYVFAFDIGDLRDEDYEISFSFREYAGGELISDSSSSGYQPRFSNRTRISEFPEDQQKGIIEEGSAYDAENDIYTLSDRLLVSTIPSAADSIVRMTCSVVGQGRVRRNLSLRPLVTPAYDQPEYKYNVRPFKVGAFNEDEFIPLVLYGSFWYDEKFNIVRFCGEKELEPDFTNDMFRLIPHYYVVGVTLKKK